MRRRRPKTTVSGAMPCATSEALAGELDRYMARVQESCQTLVAGVSAAWANAGSVPLVRGAASNCLRSGTFAGDLHQRAPCLRESCQPPNVATASSAAATLDGKAAIEVSAKLAHVLGERSCDIEGQALSMARRA